MSHHWRAEVVGADPHMNPFATGFAMLLSLLALEGALLLSLGGWTPVFAGSGYVIVFIAGFATA